MAVSPFVIKDVTLSDNPKANEKIEPDIVIINNIEHKNTLLCFIPLL